MRFGAPGAAAVAGAAAIVDAVAAFCGRGFAGVAGVATILAGAVTGIAMEDAGAGPWPFMHVVE